MMNNLSPETLPHKTQQTVYRCPICHAALLKNNQSYTCEKNHGFDLAKEGYVNLLPVQFKQSKKPGDNKAMVNARRAFLEQGYYQPLVDKLVSLYQAYNHGQGNFLDAGCGEGFYTHQHKTDNNQVFAVDISKEAIKKAAKKYPQAEFSVATLSQLPFADESFQWLLSIYAPILEAEFTRVMAVDGYLLTVTPANKHLFQLKSLIYQAAKEHDVEREPIRNLALIHQEQLTYTMTLAKGEDTLNLLSMTPFAFKASEAVKAEIAAQNNFECQADFLIKLYQKQA